MGKSELILKNHPVSSVEDTSLYTYIKNFFLLKTFSHSYLEKKFPDNKENTEKSNSQHGKSHDR